jgi:hypothetical protein
VEGRVAVVYLRGACLRHSLPLILVACLACNGSIDPIQRAEGLPDIGVPTTWSWAVERGVIELSGGIGDIDIELPSDSLAVAVTVRGTLDAEYLVVGLDGPAGTWVHESIPPGAKDDGSLGAAAGPFFSPNRSVGARGGATLFAPNDPELRFVGGTWSVRVRSTDPVSHAALLEVRSLRADVYAAQAQLPLRLMLSGADEMRAAGAAEHPRLQAALAEVEQIFASIGVQIGPISYHDIDSSYRTLSGVDTGSESFRDLFAQSAGMEPGIPLFVVERFDDGAGGLGAVGGISAAIPGTPQPGDRFAGVVVATAFSNPQDEADLLGVTMAHEIGHFLGLFHSTEANGMSDGLSDTGLSDEGNLMHFLSRAESNALTPYQGFVVRSHPVMTVEVMQ